MVLRLLQRLHLCDSYKQVMLEDHASHAGNLLRLSLWSMLGFAFDFGSQFVDLDRMRFCNRFPCAPGQFNSFSLLDEVVEAPTRVHLSLHAARHRKIAEFQQE